MNYSEFRKETLKINEHREHKITNSVGVYYIYKQIRKHKWYNIGRPLTEKEFYKIIRLVNTYLGEELLKGRDVEFPQKMGKLELRKFTNTVKFIDGKLKTSYPIDWEKTLQLWYEDNEALHNKTLIRNTSKESITVKYNTFKANYQNKSFMQFKLNRELKKEINRRFKKGYIDAFKKL